MPNNYPLPPFPLLSGSAELVLLGLSLYTNKTITNQSPEIAQIEYRECREEVVQVIQLGMLDLFSRTSKFYDWITEEVVQVLQLGMLDLFSRTSKFYDWITEAGEAH